VLLLVVWWRIDWIVKSAVESVGSSATGSEVTLKEVDISLTSGQASMNGLTVGNPQGFATDSAIRLGGIKVVLDTASLTSDTIVVKEVLIDGPEVTYELGTGGSNIGAIQTNVDRFAGGDAAKPSEKAPAAEEGGGKKIIIEKLTIQQGRVEVAATFLGNNKLGAPLPSITLTDIGKESGGATPGEIAAKILDAITGGVTDVVGTLGLDKLAKGAGVVIDEAGKVLEGAGQGIKDLFGK
jgi:hypothetical protein